MKQIVIIGTFSFMSVVNVFSQGPNANPAPAEIANVNFSSLVNINDNNFSIQAQQANPPVQTQQQGFLGNLFGSNENGNGNPNTKIPCKDCDAVKQALRAAHHSGSSKRKPISLKRRGYIFSERAKMKLRKTFSHRKKIHTSYEVCFNWH